MENSGSPSEPIICDVDRLPTELVQAIDRYWDGVGNIVADATQLLQHVAHVGPPPSTPSAPPVTLVSTVPLPPIPPGVKKPDLSIDKNIPASANEQVHLICLYWQHFADLICSFVFLGLT